MKVAKGRVTVILLLSALSAGVFGAEPGDEGVDQNIPHAINNGGLTGLLYTSSAYGLSKGRYEIGTGVILDRSRQPPYGMLQIPINIAYGLSDHVELGFSGKSIYLDTVGQGMGDVEVSAKWRLNDPERSQSGGYWPAVAIGAGLILPTAQTGLGEVSNWGARLMFLAALEGTLQNGRYIGTYLDAQLVTKDPDSASPYNDTYWVLNLGILLPWWDNRNFQMIGELNFVQGKDSVSLYTPDYRALTLALRYASDTIRLSTGFQFVDKLPADYRQTVRTIATASVEL